MKKIKAFFYTFKNSLISPSYYKDLFKTDIKFSLKYLSVLALFVSLFVTVILSIIKVPQINQQIKTSLENSRNYYPEDLVVTISGDDWFINQSQPYVLPIPDVDNGDIPKNLITFYKEGTIDDLETFDTLILFNKENIIIKNQNEIRVTPIENFPDIRIDKGVYENGIARLSKILRIFIPVMILMMFTGLFLFFGVMRGVYVFIPAFVIWLLGKGLGIKDTLTYKNSYKICLHSMTLPLLIQGILIIFDTPCPFRRWFFYINLLLAFVIIFSLDKKQTEAE